MGLTRCLGEVRRGQSLCLQAWMSNVENEAVRSGCIAIAGHKCLAQGNDLYLTHYGEAEGQQLCEVKGLVLCWGHLSFSASLVCGLSNKHLFIVGHCDHNGICV